MPPQTDARIKNNKKRDGKRRTGHPALRWPGAYGGGPGDGSRWSSHRLLRVLRLSVHCYGKSPFVNRPEVVYKHPRIGWDAHWTWTRSAWYLLPVLTDSARLPHTLFRSVSTRSLRLSENGCSLSPASKFSFALISMQLAPNSVSIFLGGRMQPFLISFCFLLFLFLKTFFGLAYGLVLSWFRLWWSCFPFFFSVKDRISNTKSCAWKHPWPCFLFWSYVVSVSVAFKLICEVWSACLSFEVLDIRGLIFRHSCSCQLRGRLPYCWFVFIIILQWKYCRHFRSRSGVWTVPALALKLSVCMKSSSF